MSFRDQLNQLKNKAEDLNKKHNILPFGQNKLQQTPGSSQSHNYPAQQYPGQQPPPQQQQWQAPPPPSPSARPPPPVPMHSRPSGAGWTQQQGAPPQQQSLGNPQVYWRARPEVPVGQEFEQKEGHGPPWMWGWGNNELENYTSRPDNSFWTADGTRLVVRAISQPQHPDPEAKYTSARLVTRQTLARPRGCLTAWLTLPCAEGIWPAFWLLPREPFEWPHEGEIDVAESWNADCQNHSCLHWGAYTPEDSQKHLVRQTHIPDMACRLVRYDLVWNCEGTGRRPDGKSAGGGRLMWYIDGRPVMKNLMPPGTRPIEDWCVLLNVAMGGNVCGGKAPPEGTYDMVVQGLQMAAEPEGGWWKFDNDWPTCPDGVVM